MNAHPKLAGFFVSLLFLGTTYAHTLSLDICDERNVTAALESFQRAELQAKAQVMEDVDPGPGIVSATYERAVLQAQGQRWSPSETAACMGQESSSALETTLRETEERRLQSLVDFDLEVADVLHADDFQLVNPAGGVLSKQDYLGGLESGALDYVTFEPMSEIQVRVYGDVAMLLYQSKIEIHLNDGFVDTGQFWHTDLYELRGSGWQVVWSQATKIA